MRRRIHSLIAGVIAIVMVGAGTAVAQGPRGGGPGGRGAMLGRGGGLPLAALNLTQPQQELIRDMRERQREAVRQFDQRLRDAQIVQRDAMDAIPANEASIRAATLALAEVQADIAIQQARLQSEIWSVLTPTQQQEAQRLRTQQQERRAQRGERRGARQ